MLQHTATHCNTLQHTHTRHDLFKRVLWAAPRIPWQVVRLQMRVQTLHCLFKPLCPLFLTHRRGETRRLVQNIMHFCVIQININVLFSWCEYVGLMWVLYTLSLSRSFSLSFFLSLSLFISLTHTHPCVYLCMCVNCTADSSRVEVCSYTHKLPLSLSLSLFLPVSLSLSLPGIHTSVRIILCVRKLHCWIKPCSNPLFVSSHVRMMEIMMSIPS